MSLLETVVEKATELMTRQCYLENAQCRSVWVNLSELNPSCSVEDYLYEEWNNTEWDDSVAGTFIGTLLDVVDYHR